MPEVKTTITPTPSAANSLPVLVGHDVWEYMRNASINELEYGELDLVGVIRRSLNTHNNLNSNFEIPPDHKLMPLEPTPEMMAATATAFEGVNTLIEIAMKRGVGLISHGNKPPFYNAYKAAMAVYHYVK